MALIVEDGSGKTDAESYVTVAECTAYHLKHGGEAWDAIDNQEAALRKSTQYLDTMYRWKGSLANTGQALKWPRYDVFIEDVPLLWDVIPEKLKAACCELAAKGDLFADVDSQHVASVKVGTIERTMSAPSNGGQKRYAAVDALVRELIVGGSGGASIQLVRS